MISKTELVQKLSFRNISTYYSKSSSPISPDKSLQQFYNPKTSIKSSLNSTNHTKLSHQAAQERDLVKLTLAIPSGYETHRAKDKLQKDTTFQLEILWHSDYIDCLCIPDIQLIQKKNY